MAASMTLPNSAAATSISSGVIVWEWQNEFSRWRPYEPHVAHYIERHFNGSGGQVYLGNVDPSLALYILDLRSMLQIRQGTGTGRSVRRSVLPLSSPAGQGVVWQWEGDNPGTWHSYDLDISDVLETAFTSRQPRVDLCVPPFNIPYTICLQTMIQIRKETQRRRSIRRELLSMPYPPAKALSQVPVGFAASSSLPTNSVGNSSASSGSALPTSAPAHGIPMPLKKRAISDLMGTQMRNTLGCPYSLRKRSQPGQSLMSSTTTTSSSLNKAASAPGVFQHQQLVNTGLGVPGSLPLPGSVMSNGLSGPLQGAQIVPNQHIHNTGLYLPSASVPSQLSAAASSRLAHPNTSLHPAMTSMTNILVSPAVPTMHSMSGAYTMPTSVSLPALRGSHIGWPKTDKGPVKIRNDMDKVKQKKDTAEEVLRKYITVISAPPNDEDCCICCERLGSASGFCSDGQDCEVYRLDRCSHMFHKLCLHQMYDSGHKDGSIQCPTCKTIYGEKCGNCPFGEMEYCTIHNHLPSYTCPTIQVKYDIRPGVQGSEHPHPGKRFNARGFPRYGFLPDNEDGRKVLQLLIIAWRRRLTFTIGQSTTTGETDTVTWNEIHHKTEFGSNSSGHGYPDPKYIENILMELAVQGVTEDDLPM